MSISQTEKIKSLQTIGLSEAASRCYLLLATEWPRRLGAGRMKRELGIPGSSLYRALHELANKGFVDAIRIVRATSYRAEPLTRALDNYAMYQRMQVLPLIKEQHEGVLQNSPLSRTIRT